MYKMSRIIIRNLPLKNHNRHKQDFISILITHSNNQARAPIFRSCKCIYKLHDIDFKQMKHTYNQVNLGTWQTQKNVIRSP